MRPAGILILCCLAIQPAFADETNLVLTVDGVTYSNVTFGTVTPSSVTIFFRTGVASIALEKLPPDVQKQLGYSPEKIAELRTEEAKARAAKLYANAKAFLKCTSDVDSFKGEDRTFVEGAASVLKMYVERYETYGPADDELQTVIPAMDKTIKMFDLKPVFGYRYNEIVRDEVAVPIIFDMYSNSAQFYLRVGDGDFCTVAPIALGKIREIVAGLNKALEWAEQCRKEQLNAEKLVGDWSTVRLEFVSKDGGAHCFIWLRARGPFTKQSLLEDNTVKLNMLNIRCLAVRMVNARNIAMERLHIERDSERLK